LAKSTNHEALHYAVFKQVNVFIRAAAITGFLYFIKVLVLFKTIFGDWILHPSPVKKPIGWVQSIDLVPIVRKKRREPFD
jgi:hypothetical protein